MKVGFKINLKNYEMLSVDSSEHEDGMSALKELYNFLKQFDHPEVKRFINSFYGSRVKSETPEMKEREKIVGARKEDEAHGVKVKKWGD